MASMAKSQYTNDGRRKTVRGCHGLQLSNGTESAAERFPVISVATDADYSDLL